MLDLFSDDELILDAMREKRESREQAERLKKEIAKFTRLVVRKTAELDQLEAERANGWANIRECE
jgi:hypothetical protein